MNNAAITESLKKVLEKEQKRIAGSEAVSQSIKMVEELESTGVISKVKYRLPLTDAIGRTATKTRVSE
jgi:hypothetical protein